MNRLKCVLGINVPCRMTSTVQMIQHPKDVCKHQDSEVQLVKPTRFLVPRKKSHDYRSFHCASHQPRNKPKLQSAKKMILERGCSLKCEQRRRSSNPLQKPLNRKSPVIQSNEKLVGTVRDVDSPKYYGTHMTRVHAEREPRSYAQLIASYNESMYAQYNSISVRDGMSHILPNGIRKSPFSTSSVVSLKWRNTGKTGRGTSVLCTTNSFNQIAKFSSESIRNEQAYFSGSNDAERTLSYASMIEKYSNAINVGICSRNWSNNLVPRRNVSTSEKLFSMMLLDAKDIEGASPNVELSRNKDGRRNLNESAETDIDTHGQTSWAAKVEDVIRDLKRITERRDAFEEAAKLNEKLMLQSVNERAQWVDRVICAHKKQRQDKNLHLKQTGSHSQINTNSEPEVCIADKSTMLKDNSILQTPLMSTNTKNPSKPITNYIKREPVNANPPNSSQSTSSQRPTTTATMNPSKEPQIELRMTPSQNESVVSINVDELAERTAGSTAKDQLSVVISSQRNRTGNVDPGNLNLRSDFGSMQISISENTVPVKQIEFSINGKPVSELKSIVARADKLDVFSSMDKVEIRIPSSKDSVRMAGNPANPVTASMPGSKPVLNLQIAAKFNEPRVQTPSHTGLKTATNTTPPTQLPPNPPSTHKIIKAQPVGNFSVTNDRAAVPNEETIRNVADGVPSLLNPASGRSTPGNIPYQPRIHIDTLNMNEPSETRTPSNAIPWWSSEDSFKKIRKKSSDEKIAVAPEIHPKEAKKSVNVVQKVEKTMATNQQGAIDTLKKDMIGKDIIVKKQVVDEDELSANLPDSVLRVIRVPSSPKWVPFKPSTRARSPNRKNALKRGRVDKMKYRCTSVPHSTRNTDNLKKNLGMPTDSPVPSSKLAKYVAVTPKKATINGEPEAEDKTSVQTKEKASEQQATTSKVEAVKVEKPSPPKSSTSDVEKRIEENSERILKRTNELLKTANRSADATAKSKGPMSRYCMDVSKEKKPDKVDTKLREKSEAVDDVSSERIKEIFKSMKPIEKRRDGTLIDYGVTVPSRRPSEKFRNIPRIPGKISITLNPQKVVTESPTPKDASEQGKIVELGKQSLPKAQTQRKVMSDQEKIVEPEKICSVKKPVEVVNIETVKLAASAPKTQPEKVAKDNEEKIKNEEKASGVIKNILHSSESKNQFLKADNIKTTGQTSLKGSITKSSSETSTKVKESPNILKSTSRGPPKSIENETKSASSFSLNVASKETKKDLSSLKKTLIEETSTPSSTNKKVSSMDIPSLRTFQPQKSNVNITTKENIPSEKSDPQSSKKFSKTDTVPKPNDQSKLTFSNVNEKKANLEVFKGHKGNSSPKLATIKPPSNKGDTDPKEPMGFLTGPSSSGRSPASFMTTQAKSDKQANNDAMITRHKGEPTQTYLLFSNNVDRPEKNMLYSAWLQRFRDRYDDDKVI